MVERTGKVRLEITHLCPAIATVLMWLATLCFSWSVRKCKTRLRHWFSHRNCGLIYPDCKQMLQAGETGKQGLEKQATTSEAEPGLDFERKNFPWYDTKLIEIISNHIRALQPTDNIQQSHFSNKSLFCYFIKTKHLQLNWALWALVNTKGCGCMFPSCVMKLWQNMQFKMHFPSYTVYIKITIP